MIISQHAEHHAGAGPEKSKEQEMKRSLIMGATWLAVACGFW